VLKTITLFSGNYFIQAVANNLNAKCSLSAFPIQNSLAVFYWIKGKKSLKQAYYFGVFISGS